MKIKYEEETFPCLSQTGESASSFLTHAQGLVGSLRGFPVHPLDLLRMLSCAPRRSSRAPWFPHRGLPSGIPCAPLGERGEERRQEAEERREEGEERRGEGEERELGEGEWG